MEAGIKDVYKKVPALCPVFDACGGCQYQDISYPDELRLKERQLKELLKQGLDLSDDVFQTIVPSPHEYRYRNRLDLKLIQTKSKEVFIGFSPQNGHRLIPIEDCPIARAEICHSIPAVKDGAKAKVTEKHRQANLVVRTGDDGRVFWGGIGRRSLELAPADYLWTEIGGKRIFYSLDTFFQANLYILPELMKRLRALPIWDPQAVFYDLYGGVGLFGICVQDLVGRVILIEEVIASLRVARFNVGYHDFKNFFIHDGRVEDVLPPMLEAMAQSVNIVMVDPPRAGLSEATVGMLNKLQNVKHLVYLSCNPESLLQNCKDLDGQWLIREVHPLDFFPRTRHLETLVLFERRSNRDCG